MSLSYRYLCTGNPFVRRPGAAPMFHCVQTNALTTHGFGIPVHMLRNKPAPADDKDWVFCRVFVNPAAMMAWIDDHYLQTPGHLTLAEHDRLEAMLAPFVQDTPCESPCYLSVERELARRAARGAP